MRIFAAAGICVCATATAVVSRAPLDPNGPVQRIAFGSCNKQYKAQPVWDIILARRPDVWMWLGDAIYADSPVVLTIRRPGTLDDVARGYADQLANANYSRFISQVPVIGVWDDHDVGMWVARQFRGAHPRACATHRPLLLYIGTTRTV